MNHDPNQFACAPVLKKRDHRNIPYIIAYLFLHCPKMHLMYFLDENGNRVYTLKVSNPRVFTKDVKPAPFQILETRPKGYTNQ